MIDNERRERQSFACRTLAQVATQCGEGHRVNATADGEAFVFSQLAVPHYRDRACSLYRTNVRPRELAEPLLWEIGFQ